MDTLDTYRQIIETVLTEYARVPYAYGEIQTETAFDRVHDHYLLVNVGWRNERRIHGSIVHIDIINRPRCLYSTWRPWSPASTFRWRDTPGRPTTYAPGNRTRL